jgi:hypothetical protein
VLLTAVNHGAELARGQLDVSLAVRIGVTFVVPFLVSVASSVAATRDQEATRP